jgi:hypothetical protein
MKRVQFRVPIHFIFEVDAESPESAIEEARKVLVYLDAQDMPFVGIQGAFFPTVDAASRVDAKHIIDGAEAFTVIGVYASGDKECIGERFADHVFADDAWDAEQMVKAKRGDEVMIAGVLEGCATCVDEQ